MNGTFISWLHISSLRGDDNCLNSVKRRSLVSAPVHSLASQRRCDAHSNGNPRRDYIIAEPHRLIQRSAFYSNRIAMSFPITSDYLNPLIIYQQRWSSVYCKSPGYLVLCGTFCLVLINLGGRSGLRALTATVMRLCLVWSPCTTNTDGLHGCRSGLALLHFGGGCRRIREKFHALMLSPSVDLRW